MLRHDSVRVEREVQNDSRDEDSEDEHRDAGELVYASGRPPGEKDGNRLPVREAQFASMAVESSPGGYGLAKTPAKGEVEGYPAFGEPFKLPGVTTHVIPFSRTEKKRWYSDEDHFDEGGLAASGERSSLRVRTMSQPIRWHNAVLHDAETGEQWTLLDRRGVISRFWMKVRPAEGGGHAVRGLLFAVTHDDTNGDGRLDNRDASRALMTDGDGRNPRYVTPTDLQLSDVLFDNMFNGHGNIAVLLLREDADGDGGFRESEIPVRFTLDLDSAEPAEPLVRDGTRTKLDRFLD